MSVQSKHPNGLRESTEIYKKVVAFQTQNASQFDPKRLETKRRKETFRLIPEASRSKQLLENNLRCEQNKTREKDIVNFKLQSGS